VNHAGEPDRGPGRDVWWRRRRTLVAAGITVLLAGTGVGMVVNGLQSQSPPSPPPGAAAPVSPNVADSTASLPAPAASAAAVARPLRRSIPLSLDIPAIHVRTHLSKLGLDTQGRVMVPPLGKGAPAGWYKYLATPGETGPAVILGHVDSAAAGPAVFYRLGALRPGDSVRVTRADGSVAVFAVTRVARYSKSAFPSTAVYGKTGYPALRLVTCGGAFDPAKHSYVDNVVAYARLVSSTPA
jgi:hypothetical protein